MSQQTRVGEKPEEFFFPLGTGEIIKILSRAGAARMSIVTESGEAKRPNALEACNLERSSGLPDMRPLIIRMKGLY